MLPIVFLFIIGFSIAFSLLLSAAQGFTTVHISFLTTFVMMTGEMDYLGKWCEFYSCVTKIDPHRFPCPCHNFNNESVDWFGSRWHEWDYEEVQTGGTAL